MLNIKYKWRHQNEQYEVYELTDKNKKYWNKIILVDINQYLFFSSNYFHCLLKSGIPKIDIIDYLTAMYYNKIKEWDYVLKEMIKGDRDGKVYLKDIKRYYPNFEQEYIEPVRQQIKKLELLK